MDGKRRGRGCVAAVVCGVAVALVALLYLGIGLWAAFVEPIALPVLAGFILVPGAILFGIIYATLERIREIKGGEEDDSSHY